MNLFGDLDSPGPIPMMPELPHWLIVKEWDADEDELLDVEHHPDCPTEIREEEAKRTPTERQSDGIHDLRHHHVWSLWRGDDWQQNHRLLLLW